MINKRKNEKLNPELSFRFGLASETINESEFIIIQGFKNESYRFLEFGEEYKSFASDFLFFLGYICKNISCLPPQDEYQNRLNLYAFFFNIQDMK